MRISNYFFEEKIQNEKLFIFCQRKLILKKMAEIN